MNFSDNCNFSYNHYKQTLEKIKKTHKILTFGNSSDKDVILRHDVDASLEAALKMAELENKINVSSTYFILLSSGELQSEGEHSINNSPIDRYRFREVIILIIFFILFSLLFSSSL